MASENTSSMRALSPLRYPGGKAVLAEFLTDILDLNDLRGGTYFEPYAGGAGAALRLLKQGVVSSLCLNDADPRVYAFWQSVLTKTDRFVDGIQNTPLTIAEWHRQRAICASPKAHSQFSVGFAAFYMNRCNRSGVLSGAGPIGGYAQEGKWRLDVRFNRERLVERVIELGKMRDQISITGFDAIEFLKTKLPLGNLRKKAFVYLDPPYVNKGQRLYLNAYNTKAHGVLARYMSRQNTLPWLISYDDAELVRSLYHDYRLHLLPLSYTLQAKRSAVELLIPSRHLVMPSSFRSGQKLLELARIEKGAA